MVDKPLEEDPEYYEPVKIRGPVDDIVIIAENRAVEYGWSTMEFEKTEDGNVIGVILELF